MLRVLRVIEDGDSQAVAVHRSRIIYPRRWFSPNILHFLWRPEAFVIVPVPRLFGQLIGKADAEEAFLRVAELYRLIERRQCDV